ncbi:hypothetical protein NC653_027438 [Populus alba x Populus x berolinensis]|uniref:Methyltransferase domain-containing protein n=1 Tax=Populus alba x Populus x berolinensis TaxID=444605 RepID=A0AAD6Q6V9_9ROSI|nr:hypothetical protein NC653_027438 [Populus alba x Populus x berolinensis]
MEDCVLDLCCGSGDLAFLLSEKVDSNGGKVGNLDFSKDQLFMASKDQIFFAPIMGFENVVDKRKALQEMFRVLRPGKDVFYQQRKVFSF